MREKLWGGRFKEELHPLILEFTKSIDYDWFLFEYEAISDMAWIRALRRAGLLNANEERRLLTAIEEILKDFSAKKVKIEFEEEDVHSFFYKLLRQKVKDLVDKIHAGKSRNEQIVTLMRMFLRDAILEELNLINDLQLAMVTKGLEYRDTVIPGFTHLQFAQPLLFAHWMLSFVEGLERDKQRLIECFDRTDVLPLGSGALAGTSIGIDRQSLAEELGFGQISPNSIDAVSDRDFILEYLNVNVILLMHLSRLSEDLIIYCSPGYNFLSFSDKVTTGSSLMPHKRNPDPVELVRASFGEAISSYTFLASLLKGLPTSYNRDLQLDKKALFGSYSVAVKVLSVMVLLMNEMSLNEEVLSQLLSDEKIYSTDISEELIRNGFSWREAHERVGQLLKVAEEKGTSVRELDRALIKEILGMDLNLDRFFNPYNSVKLKATHGSTNPKFVGRELRRWQDRLSKGKGKDA